MLKRTLLLCILFSVTIIHAQGIKFYTTSTNEVMQTIVDIYCVNNSESPQDISSYTWIYAYQDGLDVINIDCDYSADMNGLNWDVEEVISYNRSSNQRNQFGNKSIEVAVFDKSFEGTILMPHQSVQIGQMTIKGDLRKGKFLSNSENPAGIIYTNSKVDAFPVEFSERKINTAKISDILLYPNPSQGLITIDTDFDYKKVYLFDAFGRVVKSFDGKHEQFDMNEIASGIYLLGFESATEFMYKRFVKE